MSALLHPDAAPMLGSARVVAPPADDTGRLSPAQQAWRRRGIGASDAGAIVAPTKYRGPFDVWLAKRGLVEPSGETGPQRWGHLLEAPVADEYVAQVQATGLAAWARPVGTLQHAAHEWALATPDRLVETQDDQWLLEVKTANQYLASEWGEPGTDEIPQHYLVQVLWQLEVTGMDRCDVAVLIGGNDFRVYRVRSDRQLQRDVLDQVGNWYERHLVQGIEPAPAGDGALEYLAQRHPKVARDLLVEADAEAAQALLALAEVKAKAKQLEELEKSLKARVQAAIGDAKGIVAGGVKATWTDVKGRATVDWERAARMAGVSSETIRECTDLKPGYRMFKVTLPKEA